MITFYNETRNETVLIQKKRIESCINVLKWSNDDYVHVSDTNDRVVAKTDWQTIKLSVKFNIKNTEEVVIW